ncbi:MAG: histidine phosphatase family protein [Alphaproteobacteria bacterium]|nr:histidine phosphatase family protein [Alphaproteobacteria bacterium]
MPSANAISASPVDGHVDLILVRHAESTNNMLYDVIRTQHGAQVSETAFMHEEARARHPDPGLSERGLRQLEHLQSYQWHDYFLKTGAFPKCKVFSSPMRRCLQTAQAIGISLQSCMDGPITVHPSLFEEGGCYHRQADGTPVGLPGSTWCDISAQFPDFDCLQATPRGWYDRPHMETSAEFDARAHEMVGWIWSMQQDLKRSGHGALVLVTHGNIMSAIMSILFSGTPSKALYKHSNTGHSHIELFSLGNRNMVVCQSINKVTHLLNDRQLIGGDHTVDDRWIQQFAARD